MHPKKYTILKTIGIILCLTLCGVFCWYYLAPSTPAGHKSPSKEVVESKENDIPATNSFNNGDEGASKTTLSTIANYIRTYKAWLIVSSGVLACAILYFIMHRFIGNNRDIRIGQPDKRKDSSNNLANNDANLPPPSGSDQHTKPSVKPKPNKKKFSHGNKGKEHRNNLPNKDANLPRPSGSDHHTKPSVKPKPKKKKLSHGNKGKEHRNNLLNKDANLPRPSGSDQHKKPIVKPKQPKEAQKIAPLLYKPNTNKQSNQAKKADVNGNQKNEVSPITLKQYQHLEKVLSAMLSQESLQNNKVNDGDVSLFKKLIAGGKGVPPAVKKMWGKFIGQQDSITIDMKYMYQYYKAFMPLLTDINCKNLLLFDKIANMFPNVMDIICKNTNYVGKEASKYKPNQEGYSSSVVTAEFTLELQKMVATIFQNETSELGWIDILLSSTSGGLLQGDDFKSTFKAFYEQGWYIGRGAYRIVLLDLDYIAVYYEQDFEPNLREIIDRKGIPEAETSLDIHMYDLLTTEPTKVSGDVRKKWKYFKERRSLISLSIDRCRSSVFFPKLFATNDKGKYVLRLGEIAKVFPKVTAVRCWGVDEISSDYITDLFEQLKAVPKEAKLSKIYIYSKFVYNNLDYKAFNDLGWHEQVVNQNKIVLTKIK